jgi:hypothetical protein
MKNLRPRRWSSERKAFSGAVSRDRFACITLRDAGDVAEGASGTLIMSGELTLRGLEYPPGAHVRPRHYTGPLGR